VFEFSFWFISKLVDMCDKFFYPMFGRGELGEREVEGRDRREVDNFSCLETKEIGERESKHVGPTCFLFLFTSAKKGLRNG